MVNNVYILINIIELCLMFGVISSVFPSATYNLFKLTDDGSRTDNNIITPNPPIHWSRLLQILIQNATGTSEYIVNPVEVIPDMDSKYESTKDKSRENIIGNAHTSAESIQIDNTKMNEPLNDKSLRFFELHE